ncbi:hypothetical protein [Methylobacterium isbiliense]|uniref:hypothetical protein n=1 Tax=Methylobacterium isbiliense TaxID=315478 RepID=UPI001EE39D58|nr:hypothetical protein [Methylobacterium isbiliense]MDN3625865.1 hypothetical protein [Methylobacterium isbiliense]
MADYNQTTIVQPVIPISLMTPLERGLLEQMFEGEWDDDKDEAYLYSVNGIESGIDVSDPEFLDALQNDTAPLAANVRAEHEAAAKPDHFYLYNIEHTDVLQAIVARHPDKLPHISLETACTCTRLCPLGFGGWAELITATAVQRVDTGVWLADQIAALHRPMSENP